MLMKVNDAFQVSKWCCLTFNIILIPLSPKSDVCKLLDSLHAALADALKNSPDIMARNVLVRLAREELEELQKRILQFSSHLLAINELNVLLA